MRVRLTYKQVKDLYSEAQERWSSNGLEYLINCLQPHKKGGILKLSLNPEKGVFYCHDCHWTGQIAEQWPQWDEISQMMEDLCIKDVPRSSVPEIPRPIFSPNGEYWAPRVPAPGNCVRFSDLPDDHVAVEYMRNRGFDIEDLRGLHESRALLYCVEQGFTFPPPLRQGTTVGRIIIPVYMKCAMVGWQARVIDYVVWENEKEGEKKVWYGDHWRIFKKSNGLWEDKHIPKYYNSPEFPRRNTLFGYDIAKNISKVAVVEGALDVYRVGDACVGLLGGNGFATYDQIQHLHYWETLFWLLDPNVDLSQPETKRKWEKQLKDLVPAKVYPIHLSSGLDPGATPREVTWREIASRTTKQPDPHFQN